MKRLFFMFLALLLCVMVQAQDNVEITLNNGNVVKGVTKTLFMLDDGDVVDVFVAVDILVYMAVAVHQQVNMLYCLALS